MSPPATGPGLSVTSPSRPKLTGGLWLERGAPVPQARTRHEGARLVQCRGSLRLLLPQGGDQRLAEHVEPVPRIVRGRRDVLGRHRRLELGPACLRLTEAVARAATVGAPAGTRHSRKARVEPPS